MRYISNLNKKTVAELEKIVKNDISFQTRQRAHAILLSNDGISIKEICKIFNKSTRTVYRWFDRFKEEQTNNLSCSTSCYFLQVVTQNSYKAHI